MALEKQPFTRYNEEKKDDTFNIRLGKDFSREDLETAKRILEQERDATTMKQLAMIGLTNVLHDQKTKTILAIVFKNKRNNKRHGIVTFDPLS